MFKLLFALSVLLAGTEGTTYKMGIFLPFEGSWPGGKTMASAIHIALDKIKNDTTLLSGHNLSYVVRDSSCRANKSLHVLSDYYIVEDPSVDVFIGPGCSVACTPAGWLADKWNLPMISWGCTSALLSNKDQYPTFVRTAGTYFGIGSLFSNILTDMKWNRIGLLCSSESLFTMTCSTLQVQLLAKNFTVPYYGSFDPFSVTNDKLKTMFKAAKGKTHVFFIAAYGNGVRQALLAAQDNGMMNGVYAFYTLETLYSSCTDPKDTAERNEAACRAFEGVIDIRQYVPETAEYLYFKSEVRRRMPEMGNYEALAPNVSISPYASYLHDAIYLYALALNATLAKNASANVKDGRQLMKALLVTTFQGASGPVGLNEKGDRSASYMLQNVKNGAFQKIYNFFGTTLQVLNATILWPGGGTIAPLGRPVCGFDNEFCPEEVKEETETWPYIVVGALIFVITVAALVGYMLWQRKKAFEAALRAQMWRMKYEDINWPKNKKAMGSRKSMMSMAGSQGAASHDDIRGQVFTTLGTYEGTLVAVKKIYKASVALNRDQLLELKETKDLNHQNVNLFVGACVEPPNICLVTHYCNKGSLQDVLYNDDMKLDWMFQMSIASDIARGLHYLHGSPILVHGNLKSSNVVIDSRWTCKLTDFGLFLFKDGQEVDVEAGGNEDYENLWTAPEHLYNRDFPRSKAGDVYGFGIILQEIVTRNLPFGMYEDLDPKGIVARVRKEEDPPFRPRLTADLVGHPQYIQMAKDCWNQSPPLRPKPNDCLKQLKLMNKGKDINIMDNMINMMEKYTDHLEEIVAERTKELSEEKAKTDELLYRMLPRSVAEELKRGQTVTAETFDCVTIFFSDIVGFTKLAGASTPLQVVDLLNDLYTTFDEIIDLHDVYKVETIGDAYMVASGLPNRNGKRHAGEIANMSLDLLAAMTTFKVRHVPGQQLQLRIGIHSGPCVAGVVGLKMPRYCLFGDTVNYASRIESTGLALRIHVSPECKDILADLGGYHLEERGEVSMKGKGTICTFFLNGRDGFNKALPDLALQAGLDEHTFK